MHPRLGLGATALVLGAVSLAIVLVYRHHRQKQPKSLVSVPQDPAGAAILVLQSSWRRKQANHIVRAQRIERAKAHVKYGNLVARTGKPEKALKHYSQALRVNPESSTAHHNSASILQRLNRFDEAIPHYEAALRIKPSLVEAASNLAVAQLNAKRPADAVHTCRKAIEMQQKADGSMNLEASHHLNVALRLLDRRDEAVEETWKHIEALAARTAWDPTERVRPQPLALASASPPGSSSKGGGAKLGALTVVCVKWGSLYGAEYVNKLYHMSQRALGGGGVGTFVCFTEDASGLDEGIDARALPTKRDEWRGWWYKAHVFSRDAGLVGRCLYIDLDTVIVGDMSALRAYIGPFATLSTRGFDAEEGYLDGYNTSAMLWEAGDASVAGRALATLHDALRAEVFQCLMRWDHWCEMLLPAADILQELYPGVFVDYRSHCRGVDGPPAGSAVVCFPRNPKPHEVDAVWVKQHWR